MDSLSDRRHLRAVPALLRGAVGAGREGQEVGAVRGVLDVRFSGMIRGGATHVGVATDHVIESFRNRLWPGYKTSAGIEPDLLSQFPLLEEALAAARRRRLADGRVRSRRRAGGGRGDGGARSARRARVSSARPTRTSRSAVRGERVVQMDRRTRRRVRRSRRHREVRRAAGVDSRLSRAGRRCRRRLSGPAAGGARSRRRPCCASTATSKRFPPTGASGRSMRRTPARWRARSGQRERAMLFRDARDAAHRDRRVRLGGRSCNGKDRRGYGGGRRQRGAIRGDKKIGFVLSYRRPELL